MADPRPPVASLGSVDEALSQLSSVFRYGDGSPVEARERDVRTMLAALRLAREVSAAQALAEWRKEEALEGLRIADASVIPSIPAANTNATVLAIAERAAAIIGGHDRVTASRNGGSKVSTYLVNHLRIPNGVQNVDILEYLEKVEATIHHLRTDNVANDVTLVDGVAPDFTSAGYAEQARARLGQAAARGRNHVAH